MISSVLFNFCQYEPGTVPIIISAPHGGTEEPSEIADRIAGCPTSNGCVYEKDEVGLIIAKPNSRSKDDSIFLQVSRVFTH